MLKELVFASTNQGKLKEVRKICEDFNVKLLSASDVNLADLEVVEDGESYVENARKKAVSFFEITKIASMADDTGLEVNCLAGQPGLHSARYGGDISFNKKIEKLLDEIGNNPDRSARFICVIYLVSEKFDMFFQGELKGTIAKVPQGVGGFGYDSIFIPLESNKTLAELKAENSQIKTARVKAVRGILNKLKKL